MALKEMEVPESPRLYTTRYMSLGGVDYSCDITEVDKTRTPTGTNMISDEGANPVKRLGWRYIWDTEGGAIQQIYTSDGKDQYGENELPDIWYQGDSQVSYLHHPSNQPKYYGYEDIEGVYCGTEIKSSVSFAFDGAFYVMMKGYDSDVEEDRYGYYKLHEGGQSDVKNMLTDPYVPTATISVTPDGTGGVSLEPINLLNKKRIFSFYIDPIPQGHDIWLYPASVRTDDRYQKMLTFDTKVELLTSNGWSELTMGQDYFVGYFDNGVFRSGEGYQVDMYDSFKNETRESIVDPYILFDPDLNISPLVVGQDNIKVTFSPVSMAHTYDNNIYDGYYKEALLDLLSGKASAIYGHTAPDRVFIAGGINKNRVYYSGVNDPSYFPDNNYLIVGHDLNDIKGFVRSSDSLAVIKSDSVYDNALYVIRGSFLDDNMVFTVISTSAKLGALSSKSIMTLIDEPLFLSRAGVYGVMSNWYTTERTIKNRSRYLDKKLLAEEDLTKACAVVWKKYYILCVNGHGYVLDGRKQSYDNTGNTNYQYEAFYWEGLPDITCFATYNDELFFGTSDGKIGKFNTDVVDRTKYCDNGVEDWLESEDVLRLKERETDVEYDGETVPIVCEWSTLLDDDGRPQYFKTLNKKGNLVTLLPQEQSSCWVELNKDGEKLISLDKFYADIFDWALVDFERFPFSSNITARDDYFRKKVKKYKRLQIIIRNDALFEPFGILGITKTYTVGNFAK